VSRADKVVVVVIDGLTPAMLEWGIESGRAPSLAALAAVGRRGLATSVFPSLTPVCIASIATGAYPDVHEIPHLVWCRRHEGRLVEYGSSFGAARAAGLARTLRDTLVGLNRHHLGAGAVTVFEALADAGLRTAAVNLSVYRGRTAHRAPVLGTVWGPEHFFFYNLFSSARTGAPLSWRNRAAGTIDAYAAAVGRWLVTRDAFDLLLFYLSDLDYASHEHGPDGVRDALVASDAALGTLVEAAGGLDAFLERYAVLVLSDHGQTPVDRVVRLEPRFADVPGVVVTASNRAGQLYVGDALDARAAAARLDGEPAVEVALFREGPEAVARREREELRFAPAEGGWRLSGDRSLLDGPDALARAWTALQNPNAGDVLLSAASGWELADLAGGHHAGGGSHGSLSAGDSTVPVLAVGFDALPASIADLAPLVLARFGVARPGYQLARAA
jgi:predicted AlkP superfamily pyrophosphatase or phosphodiesterase